MKKLIISLTTLINLSLIQKPVFAQNFKNGDDKSLNEKFTFYSKNQSFGTLFAHIDKTIYVSNETIMFTAYLLDYDLKNHASEVLTLVLEYLPTKKIIGEQKYFMSKGISFGQFIIPDTIPAGDYNFLLFTNKVLNGKPLNVFTQPITICSSIASSEMARNASLNKKPIKQISENLDSTSIKFYPEGGRMINSIFNNIAWETKDFKGQPLQTHGFLLENNTVIDTVRTNNYGFGNFKIIPKLNMTYALKLFNSEKKNILPKASFLGPTLTVNKAVVNDTLKVRLFDSKPEKFTLLIHNNKEVFYSQNVNMNAGMKLVMILLADVPKGLSSITLLDSGMRPLQQRTFFAHYNNRFPIVIKPDKVVYNIRDQVKVTIEIPKNQNIFNKAIVSVACVRTSRLESLKTNNIEDYFYLTNQLSGKPLCVDCLEGNKSGIQIIEDLLLTRAWTRFNWMDLRNISSKDTILNPISLKVSGILLKSGKPVTKPTPILIKSDSNTFVARTEAKGHFVFENRWLLSPTNHKINLVFNDPKSSFSIMWAKDFTDMAEAIISSSIISQNYRPRTLSLNQLKNDVDDLSVSIFANTKVLKTVNIRATREDKDGDWTKIPASGANACGDYVCHKNVLNCPVDRNSASNTKPTIGQIYLMKKSMADNLRVTSYGTEDLNDRSEDPYVKVSYIGCTEFAQKSGSIQINGIQYSQEYYQEDQLNVENSNNIYNSTIFWKHFVFIDKDNPAKINFTTSDLTGSFKIIIQGLTDMGVTYNSYDLQVVKK